jgi:hypothetical protein
MSRSRDRNGRKALLPAKAAVTNKARVRTKGRSIRAAKATTSNSGSAPFLNLPDPPPACPGPVCRRELESALS